MTLLAMENAYDTKYTVLQHVLDTTIIYACS